MRIHIFESSLKDKIGHYYEYNKSLLDGLRPAGIEAAVYCHREADRAIVEEFRARPAFARTATEGYFRTPVISYLPNLLLMNFRFFLDLRRANRGNFRPDDMALFSTVGTNHLFGLFVWFLLVPRTRRPRLFFLFRMAFRHLDRFRRRLPVDEILYRAAFFLFNRVGGGKRVHYLADSEPLAADYGRMAGREVTVMPIPHLPAPPETSVEPGEERRAVFAYLGPAREEKGFALLADAVERVLAFRPDVECRLQFVSPETAGSVRRSEARLRMLGPRVTLVEGPLDTEGYYRLLGASSCVLLPYDPARYQGRTSGVLAEAIAFGKVVITTPDTWMAHAVEKHKCGIVMGGYDADALARAMLLYLGARTEYERDACKASTAWLDFHNPRQYVRILKELAAPGREPGEPGIAGEDAL